MRRPAASTCRRPAIAWRADSSGWLAASSAPVVQACSCPSSPSVAIPWPSAVATSTVVGLPLSVLGTIAYATQPSSVPGVAMLGHVFLPAFVGISLGSVISAPVGARLSKRLPAIALKRAFALALLVLADQAHGGLIHDLGSTADAMDATAPRDASSPVQIIASHRSRLSRHMIMNKHICGLAVAALLPLSAFGQQADLVLRNGNILTMDANAPRASALAIRGERLIAVGDEASIAARIGSDTRVVDLQGRTVVPGLIDTHIHAIRGGQTYTFETYWFDAASLTEALTRLQRDASRRPADQWVAVVGSWHPLQFRERRAPTVADLDQAVPNHPAYVQYLYDYALLNTRGIEALRLDAARPPEYPGINVERNAQGRATGKLFGGIGAFNALFARLSRTADHEGA